MDQSIWLALFVSGLIILTYLVSNFWRPFRWVLKILAMLTYLAFIGWLGWEVWQVSGVGARLCLLALLACLLGKFTHIISYLGMVSQSETKTDYTFSDVKSAEYQSLNVVIRINDEEYEVLQRTVVAALNIYHPRPEQVQYFILDEKGRPEIKDLAQELKFHYLDNTLSGQEFLAQLPGKLTLMLAGDSVSQKTILSEVLPELRDSRVGFVVLNKDNYNDYVYSLTTLGAPSELMQIQRQRFNAVFSDGYDALYVTEALRQSAFDWHQRDLRVGINLQAAGYQGNFLARKLLNGLAAESLVTLAQRIQYEAFRDSYARRHLSKGTYSQLNRKQKKAYGQLQNFWSFAWQRLTFLLLPVVITFLGITIPVNYNWLVAFGLPALVATGLVLLAYGRSFQSFYSDSIYETALSPQVFWAKIKVYLAKKATSYQTLHKDLNMKSRLQWRKVWFQIVMLVLMIFALVILNFHVSMRLSSVQSWFLLVWLLYNLILLGLTLFLFIEQPRYRRAERFKSDKKCQVRFFDGTVAGRILNWNETGARIRFEDSRQKQETRSRYSHGNGWLMVDGLNLAFETMWLDNRTLGLRFSDIDLNQYRYLVEMTYAQPMTMVKETQQQEPNRKDLRIAQYQEVSYRISQIPFTAVMLDISNHGCRLRLEKRQMLQAKSLIEVKVDKTWRLGEIRWLQSDDNYQFVGIKFVD